ncbi:hypothetical protein HAHI6034_01735 [Hathewaya histolytica]|uniref:Uncharacterized protein n=1 Tax=Hathewaya histolytica TaxID=1498 RepID=A0A4U9R001_HATHI|nr:hypothetical protein [Hathewaya histolytica]VTQ84259.1 Uncharacterised protein [Hathewaya histolytica]
MPVGGGTINGRRYSQHAMERMAPNTPEVKAELYKRAKKIAKEKGLVPQTKEYSKFIYKYVDPRNIPPSVIEDAIKNTKPILGNRPDTFAHTTDSVKVIISGNSDIITVIPKQWRNDMYIKYDEYEMFELFNSEPVSIGSVEEGELIYSYKDNQDFSVTLFMNVYAQLAELTLSYKENIIFNSKLKEVKTIEKVDGVLIIHISDGKRIRLKFYPQVGVELLND